MFTCATVGRAKNHGHSRCKDLAECSFVRSIIIISASQTDKLENLTLLTLSISPSDRNFASAPPLPSCHPRKQACYAPLQYPKYSGRCRRQRIGHPGLRPSVGTYIKNQKCHGEPGEGCLDPLFMRRQNPSSAILAIFKLRDASSGREGKEGDEPQPTGERCNWEPRRGVAKLGNLFSESALLCHVPLRRAPCPAHVAVATKLN